MVALIDVEVTAELLSDDEMSERFLLERKIERSLLFEVERWKAFRELIEKRLYRPLTKAEYCQTRWGFSEDAGELRVFAAKMIEAIEEIEEENPTNGRVIPIPEKLDQIRTFRGFPLNQALSLYKQSVERNGGSLPTRRVCNLVVSEHTNKLRNASLISFCAWAIVKVRTDKISDKSCYCRVSGVNKATVTVWQRDMQTEELVSRRLPLTEVCVPIDEGDTEDEVMTRITAIEETLRCSPIDVQICTLLKRAVFLTPTEEAVLKQIEVRVGLVGAGNIGSACDMTSPMNPPVLEVLPPGIQKLDSTIIVPLLNQAQKIAQVLPSCRDFRSAQMLFLDIKNEEERLVIKQMTWELLTPKQQDKISRLRIPFRQGDKVVWNQQVYGVEVEGQSFSKLEGVEIAVKNEQLSLVSTSEEFDIRGK